MKYIFNVQRKNYLLFVVFLIGIHLIFWMWLKWS